ncbi:MAG TPA: copper resistance protein B [Myxococcota bacterium]|nr:copper resistance protein B [Myxococcota bacterium]
MIARPLRRARASGFSILGAAMGFALAAAPCPHAQAEPEPTPDENREDWPPPMEPMLFHFAQVDQLEWRANDGHDLFRWDLHGWWGSDENKLWLKSEGDARTSRPSGGDAEIQLLYGRMISDFWDLQLGVREDFLYGAGSDHERTLAVLGLDGLAPYWFELEPALFVSDDGDFSARLTALYELRVTRRLVAQPRLEVNVAANNARKFGVRRGFNDVELGLRLRYEWFRAGAPYVGVNWLRVLGNTADLARDHGDDIDALGFVAGIRFQF